MQITFTFTLIVAIIVRTCRGKKCVDVSNHPNLHLLPQDCGIGRNDTISTRILNGDTTANSAYPWMALIVTTKELPEGWEKEMKCSGTLITDQYVLSAASCFLFDGINPRTTVWLRVYQQEHLEGLNCDQYHCSQPPLSFFGQFIKLATNYMQSQTAPNMALVRLSEKVQFEESIKPICLPISCDFRSFDFVGSTGLLLGWDHKGAEKSHQYKDALEKSLMLVVNKDTCQKDWGQDLKIEDTMMCAGVPDKGACEHDVGGPLLSETHLNGKSKWYQIGIVYDSICEKNTSVKDRVTVFTNLGDYIPYLLDNID